MVSLATLAFMAALARRANARFAAISRLPMNFGVDGTPGWHAPRRVALWFMPVLAALILVPLAILAPSLSGTAIGALCLVGGQILHFHLIDRVT
jgi:hypothetical protein